MPFAFATYLVLFQDTLSSRFAGSSVVCVLLCIVVFAAGAIVPVGVCFCLGNCIYVSASLGRRASFCERLSRVPSSQIGVC